jgi:hypothetical protein
VKGWRALGNKLSRHEVSRIKDITEEKTKEEKSEKEPQGEKKPKKAEKDDIKVGDTIEFDL